MGTEKALCSGLLLTPYPTALYPSMLCSSSCGIPWAFNSLSSTHNIFLPGLRCLELFSPFFSTWFMPTYHTPSHRRLFGHSPPPPSWSSGCFMEVEEAKWQCTSLHGARQLVKSCQSNFCQNYPEVLPSLWLNESRDIGWWNKTRKQIGFTIWLRSQTEYVSSSRN